MEFLSQIYNLILYASPEIFIFLACVISYGTGFIHASKMYEAEEKAKLYTEFVKEKMD